MSLLRTLLIAVCISLLSLTAHAFPPDQLGSARELMGDKKFAEAAEIVERFLKTNRFDGRAWSTLAVCNHMQKKFDRSIEAGQRAIELGFNQQNEMYNIACANAVMGKTDEAIAWLTKSFDSGFTEQETLEKDDEITSLRSDPRFIALTGLTPPTEESPAKRWAYDLDFLVRRMEQMHWDLYAKVSKDALRAEVERIKADAPNLSPERAKARLARLAAMVGDGHTVVSSFGVGEERVDRIPLHLELFTDGLYIIGAPEGHRDLIGGRILKIGTLSADETLKRIREYCSVDNEMGYLSNAPAKLNNPAVLQEIGAISGNEVEYTLQFADGSSRTKSVAAIPIARDELRSMGFLNRNYVYANAKATAPMPLYLQHGNESLWFSSIEEPRAMYFGCHAVADNENQSFEQFVEAMTKELDEQRSEYLIIDMRLNDGGNTGLVLPLIHALIRNERINKPGHLFVIIGRHTFSAAQNTVNLLELHTPAMFVGEPTGSRPNFVGESTYIVLPYSKLRVYCSSRYWQHVVSTDRRTWVQPQLAAELSFDDFAQNRDPCLDAILKHISAKK